MFAPVTQAFVMVNMLALSVSDHGLVFELIKAYATTFNFQSVLALIKLYQRRIHH